MRPTRATGVRVADKVAVITLDRPPLNILDLEMMDELSSTLATLTQDNNARAIVLESAMKAVFSSGADVKEHLPAAAETLIRAFERLILSILEFPKPTVAVVRGKCLGGGMELALSCDFVLASDRAIFGQPEVGVGVYPPAAAALYPRLAGIKATYQLLLTGRNISAAEAASMGLVTWAVRGEDVDSRLKELLDALTSKSQVVLRFAKRAILEGLSRPLPEALNHASTLYLESLMKTEDAVEGLTAFLEKRKPLWKDK